MEKVIWKYIIPLNDRFEIHSPKGAQILSGQIQDDSVCIWLLVNPNAEREFRILHVVGTGNPFNSHGLKFITTVQKNGFVWHLFDGGVV
jgi:hypothetical protein